MQCCYLRMSNVYLSYMDGAIFICSFVKESACRGYRTVFLLSLTACPTCTARIWMGRYLIGVEMTECLSRVPHCVSFVSNCMSNVYLSSMNGAILICFPVKESACRGYRTVFLLSLCEALRILLF